MADQYIKESFSNNEIPAMVRKLNTFYNEPFQWENCKAQKEHQDLFGRKIQSGEYYFRLMMGGSYSNDLKLSYNSMERILYILFYPNPHLINHADELIDKRQKEVRKIIEQLRR